MSNFCSSSRFYCSFVALLFHHHLLSFYVFVFFLIDYDKLNHTFRVWKHCQSLSLSQIVQAGAVSVDIDCFTHWKTYSNRKFIENENNILNIDVCFCLFIIESLSSAYGYRRLVFFCDEPDIIGLFWIVSFNL